MQMTQENVAAITADLSTRNDVKCCGQYSCLNGQSAPHFALASSETSRPFNPDTPRFGSGQPLSRCFIRRPLLDPVLSRGRSREPSPFHSLKGASTSDDMLQPQGHRRISDSPNSSKETKLLGLSFPGHSISPRDIFLQDGWSCFDRQPVILAR